MSVKVKIQLPKSLTDPKDQKKVVTAGLKAIKQVLDEEIVKTIEQGRSPVKGVGRYERYSDSYRDAIQGKATFFTKDGSLRVPRKGRNKKTNRFIENRTAKLYPNKKRSPVNLKVTGKLLKSYFSKFIRGGTLEIGFRDPKAAFHDRPAANSPIPARPMLPRDGKVFNVNIQRKLIDRATEAIRRFF